MSVESREVGPKNVERKEVEPKKVIVTGAGKGLGRAIAICLAENGYGIVAVDKNEALLAETAALIPAEVDQFSCDIRDEASITNLFASLTAANLFGLVNNAGIYLGKSIFDYSSEEISDVIGVNLKGTILFSKAFGEIMRSKKQEGCIVNISSSSIYGGSDAVYSATKAGLIGLTKACARNFSPYVRVNVVAPGIAVTDILKDIPEAVIKWYRETELIKKPIQPEDVANTVKFLLSEDARNYTGAVFDLNNGFHL